MNRNLPLVVLAMLAIVGCTSGDPEIVAIEGTVTHNGQPVPDLRIMFQPDSGRPSWAISDKNGHFVLDYDEDYDGAKVGKHTVYVRDELTNVDPTAAMSGATRPQRVGPERAAMVKKYGSATESPYKVNITKVDRNFQLKLD